MGILGDFQEIRGSFRKIGPLGRTVIITMFFLTLGAVASLADTVFAWKGFILDGVEFYRQYVTGTLMQIAEPFGLNYNKPELDALILISLSIGIGMRILCLGQAIAFDQINKKYGSSLKPNLTVYLIIGFGFPLSSWIFYGLTEQVPNFWIVGGLMILYPLVLTLPKEIMHRVGRSACYFEKDLFNYYTAYYSYLGAILLIIGILGAVNSGLHRT